jgi:large repetitive protein
VWSFVAPGAGRLSSRVAVTALAGALSFSLLGPWLNPLPAKAEPVAEQQETGELSRPDSMSASLTARSSGRRVEDLSQRTESSQVFANPDSTWTLDAYTGPQSEQAADGSWSEINTDLAFGTAGVTGSAGGADILLSDGEKAVKGVSDLAKITAEDSAGKPAALSLGWEGDLPKPELDGPTAVYPDAAEEILEQVPATTAPTATATTTAAATATATASADPAQSAEATDGDAGSGADLTVETTRSGFAHTVVLPERPAEPVELRFPLELSPGLRATLSPATGAIEVRDAADKLVFFAPKPLMWDSRTDEHSGLNANEIPVPTRIDTTGPVPAVVLSPPAAFLDAEDTQYPVTVDPTWSTMVTTDTWVQTDATSPQHGSTELRAGTWDGGVHKARSYMQFPTTALNGKKILDAKIQLNNYWSYSCSSANIFAQRITQAWNTSTLLWTNQPTATSTGQQAMATAKGFSSACPAGNVYFPVTPIVQTWADTPSSNLGVRLLAGNEADSYTWRRYTSANASTSDIASEPHLQVTYNSYPNTPTSPTIDTAQTTLWTSSTGAQTRYINTRKPKLSAIVTDPDGGSVKGLWTLTTGTTKTWNLLAGSTVSSGGRSNLTPTATTPALTEGAVYSIDVWGNDGSLSSKAPLRHTVVTVDSTAPSAPTITASARANGQWTSPKPSSNTFTFSGASTDTAKFQYSQDGAAFKDTAAATGTPAKATLSWVAEGSHSLTVRSVDRAGNISGVTTFTFGAGAAAMTSPLNETKSTDLFTVKASSPPATSGTVTPTVYWRLAGGTEPADFSAMNGSKTGWTPANVLPPVAAGLPADVNYRWSAQTAAEDLGKERVPVLLDLQVCFEYSSPAISRCTHTAAPGTQTSVLRLPHAFGNGFPTAVAGPGQAALWTGEFNTAATDVSIAAGGTDLEVSRSYSSLSGVQENSVFGPGWSSSFGVSDTGLAGVGVVDNTQVDGTIAFTFGDGESLTFRQEGNGRIQDKTGVYTAVGNDDSAGLRVEIVGSALAARLQVTDPAGSVTVFSPISYAANVETKWAPLSLTEPGAVGSKVYTRDSQGRTTRILAPTPSGVSCAATGPLAPGCRALRIDYATASTATVGSDGDIAGQVKAIWFDAYNPAKVGGAGMDTVKVAEYVYNTSKQLVRATDTRAGRSTTYSYSGTSGSGAPLLTRIVPAGLAGFTLGYGPTAQGNSSLLTVSRDNPSGSGAAVQLARYVYGINPRETSAHLPALTANDVAVWDQAADPSYGAAVFAADRPLGTSDPALVTADDWKYGQLSYTDEQGYTVNTAEYGAGSWQVSATDYQNSNIVRQFTPQAIASIKQEAANRALPAGTTLGTHNQFATITRYNPEILAAADITLNDGRTLPEGAVVAAAGSFVTDTWSPVSAIGLNGDQARTHVHMTYDEGAPTQGINLATGQPYNLATATSVYTAAAESGSPDTTVPVESGETTVRVEKVGYDPIDGASTTGPTSGWTLGLATTRTIVMEDEAQNQITKTRYDAGGRIAESRKPASNGADAGTTLTDYYTAESGTAGCGNKPEWAGLPCLVRTAEATATKPVMKSEGYTMFLATTRAVETLGTATRTTDTTYLPSGKMETEKVTAAGITGSTAISGVKYLYDSVTGAVTAVLSTNNAGTELSRTSRGYDQWGRMWSYTDSEGATTTTTFTSAGQPATEVTPHGTTTITYDGVDVLGKEERRGKATGMTITGAGAGGSIGSFAAAYNSSGALEVQTTPGGIKQRREYDPNGRLEMLSYDGKITVNGAAETGNWATWSRKYDSLGRVVGETTPDGIAFLSTAAAYARTFTYDRGSRLIRVEDRSSTPGEVINTDPDEGAITPCHTRQYSFDLNGNRTIKKSSVSGTDGICPASPATGQQWSYDGADRIQAGANDAGDYTYDIFGRQTVIPAADTPSGASAGNATLSYYDNDSVRTIGQGGATTTFALDPEGRRHSSTNGTDQLINGFSNETDNPSWVTRVSGLASTTTRLEQSLGGDLGINIEGTTVRISLSNPHQDVVSTVTLPSAGDAEGLDSWTGYDEYGSATGSLPNTGPAQYSWHGTSQRAIDTSSLVLMGARIYNPVTGLFTSVDPVAGGNSTAYAYPQDPVNNADISGKYAYSYSYWVTWRPWWKATYLAYAAMRYFSALFPIPSNCASLSAGRTCWLLNNPVYVRYADYRSGFGFLSLPGHTEGAGKYINFSFWRGWGGNYYMNVTAYGPDVTWCDRQSWCARANKIFAWGLWSHYAQRLSWW